MQALTTLVDALHPLMLEAISALLLVLIGMAADALRRKTGIEIEARHREALHSAAMTGIRSALASGLNREQAAIHALDHVSTSTPDAINHLGAKSQTIVSIAERYYDEFKGRQDGTHNQQ